VKLVFPSYSGDITVHAWFRNLRRPTGKLKPRQAPVRLPTVEALEDRSLLQGGPLTNVGFVTQLYRDVLKREPDQGGLAAWSAPLDSGQASRAQVAQGFVNSVEYHMDVVQGFYNTLLHRAADPAGLNGWTNFLAQGGTQRQLEAQFLGSDEYFITRGGATVNGYAHALYQDALNRQIDPVGLQSVTTWLSGSDTTASRTDLASIVIDSPEGDIVTIDRLYSQFLHRAPDPVGLSAFLAAFQANQTSGTDPANGSGTQPSGIPQSPADPAQAGNFPAGTGANGNNSNGSDPGPTSGLTLEQAMVAILSSPEYFSQADR
jgi:hypothetical protein